MLFTGVVDPGEDRCTTMLGVTGADAESAFLGTWVEGLSKEFRRELADGDGDFSRGDTGQCGGVASELVATLPVVF